MREWDQSGLLNILKLKLEFMKEHFEKSPAREFFNIEYCIREMEESIKLIERLKDDYWCYEKSYNIVSKKYGDWESNTSLWDLGDGEFKELKFDHIFEKDYTPEEKREIIDEFDTLYAAYIVNMRARDSKRLAELLTNGFLSWWI